jgi:hypothetical protein
MIKYTKSEFAQEIRSKYPGSYDDLSDNKLIELWFKKFPNDRNKITNPYNNIELSSNENILKEISSYLFKWIGIIICFLCALGFFISSEWLVTESIKTHTEYLNNDSNASGFLYQFELLMIDIAVWLKKLPAGAKIVGIITGGILWLVHSDE